MKPPHDWRLYLVTDRGMSPHPVECVVEAAVKGGVTAVQLREKDCSTREFVQLGRNLKAILAPLGVPLLINDRVDVALAIGADGVHIGQHDMDYESARQILGPDAIIGISIETAAQAQAAEPLGADYFGVGPIFPTPTKTDAAPALGLAGLSEVRAISRRPLVAIGGVNANNVQKMIAAGADGVAVVSAICASANPEQAARDLRRLIDAA